MENNNQVPTAKGELLTYVRKGVLWVQKEPLYIVELIKEQDLSYVMVYNVHPNTRENPQKLATEVKKAKNVFSAKTRLGQLANTLVPKKITKKWVPKPPIFVAPVVPNQIATLTGIREPGFFEREPDREIVVGGEKKIQRGKNTGVFIGLSSIDWDDKITIPTQSLLKTLTMYKEDMFYDLTGNNEDENNPLSTYYKGEML